MGRLAAVQQSDLFGAGLPAALRATRLAMALPTIEQAALVQVSGASSEFLPPVTEQEVSKRMIAAAATAVSRRDTSCIIDGGMATATVFAPDGHAVAVLCLVLKSEAGEPDHDEVKDFAADLIATIEADLWARAAKEDDAEFALAAAVSAANRASTLEGIVEALTRHGGEATGAAAVEFLVIDGADRTGEQRSDFASGPLLGRAVELGEPLVFQNRGDIEKVTNQRLIIDGVVMSSFMGLPILNDLGVVIAAIGLAFETERPTVELPADVRRLVAVTSHAVRRVLEYEAANDHATVLETVVFPLALPTSDELDLHAKYLPPRDYQRVGGDVYGAWRRPNGTTALFVADVAGHDVLATRTAALLRHGFGMATLAGIAPGEVLARVNDYLQSSFEPRLATCCYCVIDTERSMIEVANAGHPRPRILRRSGEVEAIGPFGETLMGFGTPEHSTTAVAFDEGDGLVLFSDGLIESREQSLDDGALQLTRMLGGLGDSDAKSIADTLLSSVPEERNDDVVVLVAQRPVLDRLELRWSSSELVLAAAREEMRQWLVDVADGLDRHDVLLVTDELLANARDADEGEDGSILLDCRSSTTGLTVTVTNRGPSFEPSFAMPDAKAKRGRGLPISAAVADVRVDFAGDGKVSVSARFSRESRLGRVGRDADPNS